MKERFEGLGGHRRRVEALAAQKLVGGDRQLAGKLADQVVIEAVPAQHALIQQGAADHDVFFILDGKFEVIINGRHIATWSVGDHIGEMSAAVSTMRRSATVRAISEAVVAKLTEPQFAVLADEHPQIWRTMYRELALRLDERSVRISTRSDRPKVFVVSSAEALPIAGALQLAFEHDPFTVGIWTNETFKAAEYSLESLERELDQSDFAIAVAQADDMTVSRGASMASPRDNVLLKLGLFIGRLGRKRALLLVPDGQDLKLPSDLTGWTPLRYRANGTSALAVSLGPTCTRVRNIINELGPKD